MKETTKTLIDLTEVTTIATGSSVLLADSAGKGQRISPANLKAALNVANYDDVLDNVFVMCHRKSDNYPVAYRPSEWTAQQNAGEVSTGVLIIDGGRHLVIAPTEADTRMLWSSAEVGTGYYKADRISAQQDFDGKGNQQRIMALDTVRADGDGYAPGFCASYSRLNANGKGTPAGSWWLPSLGELYLIAANLKKINYALGKITGAKKLRTDEAYWSSTEYSLRSEWPLHLGSMDQTTSFKAQYQRLVWPVSAYCKETYHNKNNKKR